MKKFFALVLLISITGIHAGGDDGQNTRKKPEKKKSEKIQVDEAFSVICQWMKFKAQETYDSAKEKLSATKETFAELLSNDDEGPSCCFNSYIKDTYKSIVDSFGSKKENTVEGQEESEIAKDFVTIPKDDSPSKELSLLGSMSPELQANLVSVIDWSTIDLSKEDPKVVGHIFALLEKRQKQNVKQ